MCGIVGVIHTTSTSQKECWVTEVAFNALLALQHRGQDAAGIMTSHPEQPFSMHKELGFVSDVFDRETISSLQGTMALGHTRYATTGQNTLADTQPLHISQSVGMVHNGNLVNYHLLRREIESNGGHLTTSNDVEVLLHLWTHTLEAERGSLTKAVIKATQTIFETVDGAYSVVGMMPKLGLFAFRDPFGIRPLVLGTDDKGNYCFASETSALHYVGFRLLREVKAGELVTISPIGEIAYHQVQIEKVTAPCMFEWVYFSGADSTLEGLSVYQTRLALGRGLAPAIRSLIRNNIVSVGVVAPIPDTARPAAIALSEELSIPYREIFLKNQYQRSFILPHQQDRERAVQLKVSPIFSEIEGKDILLVDDSIVRGTTIQTIVRTLKECGANRISVAVACPPIQHSCHYGIDLPDASTLLSVQKTADQIAQWLEVDAVVFLEVEDLRRALGHRNICRGCLDGQYPTPLCGKTEFTQHRVAK